MRKSFQLSLAVLACLTPTLAPAADLAYKAPAPVAAAPSPFYLIGQAGAGASSTQSSLLVIPGLDVQGSPKQWPTGVIVGLGAGVKVPTALGAFEFELKGNYDFTAASFGCGPLIGCLGHMRNGLLFQEMAYYSPVAAPLSFTGWQWAQGVGLYGGLGAAQRQMNACVNAPTGVGADTVQACDTAWLTGFDVGAKAEIPLTPAVNAYISYDWVDYASRVIHVDSLVFTTAFSPQQEHLFVGGLDFHF